MMVFIISSMAAGAWLVLMLTPWSRVADVLRSGGTRVRRRRRVRHVQKSAHIPRHNSRRA